MDRVPVYSRLKASMRTFVSRSTCVVRVGIALMSLAFCAILPAQTLYVATGTFGVPGVLHTINPATGASTSNRNITVSGLPVSMTGLAFHPTKNVLYGVTEFFSPNYANYLVTIDPATGAATLVGTGLGINVTDISFSAAGALYGWTDVTSDLVTINLTTGVAATIPTNYDNGTNPDGGGLGFDIDGVLYLAPQTINEPLWRVYYTENPVRVEAVSTLSFPGGPFPNNYINALAYSPVNNTLYGVNSYPISLACLLVTINPVNGAGVFLGSLPANTHAIAFDTTFASWRKLKFTTTEQANSAVSGTTAVYGQDGVPNLVKYALGIEPKTNTTTGLPSMSVSGSDWVFTYTRPTRLTDVSYAVEVSSDLVNWTTSGVTHENVTPGTLANSYVDTWRGRYPLASATNAFFRLNTKLISVIAITVSSTPYTGSPIGATALLSAADLSQALTVTYTGVSPTSYNSTTAPTNAGTYSASASYAGDANHASASASQNYTISKADTITAVTVSDATYDGSSKGGTALVTGPALSQSLTVTYTGILGTVYAASSTAPSNAGDYSAAATYAGDSNHNGSSDSKNFKINKALSTTTVIASNAIYDGSPHGGTATVTGAGGLNQSATVSYTGRSGTTYGPTTTAPTNAGNYTAFANYAGDANHSNSTGSTDYVISQVGSTTTVTTGDFSYDGNPHGQSASATGTNLNQSLTVTYTGINGTVYNASTTAPTDAGEYSASASFAGDANHTGSSDSKNYKINQVSSTTTVTVSDATFDGLPHGGTASVSGINLGQSLTVTYTGINGTDYAASTTAPTAVGDYSASATFAGDTNHTSSVDSKNFSITP